MFRQWNVALNTLGKRFKSGKDAKYAARMRDNPPRPRQSWGKMKRIQALKRVQVREKKLKRYNYYHEHSRLGGRVNKANMRDVRAERREKHRVLACQQLGNKFERAINLAWINGKIPPIPMPFNSLGITPKPEQKNKTVYVNLPDVGFELKSVHLTPNSDVTKRVCTLWWCYNPRAKIRGGRNVVLKMIDMYKGAIRNLLAQDFQLKRAPIIEFKCTDDPESMEKVLDMLNFYNQKVDDDAKLSEMFRWKTPEDTQDEFEHRQDSFLRDEGEERKAIAAARKVEEFELVLEPICAGTREITKVPRRRIGDTEARQRLLDAALGKYGWHAGAEYEQDYAKKPRINDEELEIVEISKQVQSELVSA